eukprot:m.100889 g.100889  ORF g.100889 m.100889 type:complete len:426 (+) comp8950_c0_seq2:758-2035(+)
MTRAQALQLGRLLAAGLGKDAELLVEHADVNGHGRHGITVNQKVVLAALVRRELELGDKVDLGFLVVGEVAALFHGHGGTHCCNARVGLHHDEGDLAVIGAHAGKNGVIVAEARQVRSDHVDELNLLGLPLGARLGVGRWVRECGTVDDGPALGHRHKASQVVADGALARDPAHARRLASHGTGEAPAKDRQAVLFLGGRLNLKHIDLTGHAPRGGKGGRANQVGARVRLALVQVVGHGIGRARWTNAHGHLADGCLVLVGKVAGQSLVNHAVTANHQQSVKLAHIELADVFGGKAGVLGGHNVKGDARLVENGGNQIVDNLFGCAVARDGVVQDDNMALGVRERALELLGLFEQRLALYKGLALEDAGEVARGCGSREARRGRQLACIDVPLVLAIDDGNFALVADADTTLIPVVHIGRHRANG